MTRRIWEVEYAGSPKTLWSDVRSTETQLAMAARLGVETSPDDTFAVVAASILESVGDAIGCPPRDLSDRPYELAEELRIDVSDCKSSWVAFVRIQKAIQLANLASVRRADLKPGDRVVQTNDPVEQRLRESLGDRWESVAGQFPREFEVSSIREDGQVFFKGGGQAPARYLDKMTTSD